MCVRGGREGEAQCRSRRPPHLPCHDPELYTTVLINANAEQPLRALRPAGAQLRGAGKWHSLSRQGEKPLCQRFASTQRRRPSQPILPLLPIRPLHVLVLIQVRGRGRPLVSYMVGSEERPDHGMRGEGFFAPSACDAPPGEWRVHVCMCGWMCGMRSITHHHPNKQTPNENQG